jgi:hypothetical protein
MYNMGNHIFGSLLNLKITSLTSDEHVIMQKLHGDKTDGDKRFLINCKCT